MRNKTRRTLLITTMLCSIGMLAGVLCAGNNLSLQGVLGNDNTEWGHYNGVSSAFDKKGIREYWISCDTHEVVFTAPSTGHIVDRGTPDEAFINSLDDNDSRILQPSYKTISFASSSDADLVTSVRNNFNVKTIVDDSTAPDNDGKVLKVTYKDGTADFTLNEAYLRQVFSDSSVVALNFNMKSNLLKDVHYRQQATQVRYEGNGSTGFGLNTTWKTFSYPRSAFEAFINDPNKSTINRNTLLWSGLQDTYTTFELYIDNFHPVKRVLDWTGFEKGRHNPDVTYFSWREGTVGSNGIEVCYVMDGNTSNPVTWAFDESIKTEGGRSLKVTRAANDGLQFCIRRDNIAFDTLLPNSNSIFSFDFRSSITLNCNASVSSILICQNTKLSSGTNFQIPANTWVRIAIPKSKIDRNCIFSFHGSAAPVVWFDNLQFNTNLGSFEDDTIYQVDSNYWSYGGEYINNNGHTNLDYAKVRDLKVLGYEGSVAHVALSTTRKTEGNSSLWIKQVKSDVETAIYFSQHVKKYLTDNVNSTVSLDIFRTSSSNLTFKDGNRNNLSLPGSNTWTHYELTADNLTNDGRAIIFQGSNAVGDWYIDNIQFKVPEVPEEVLNTSVLNRNIYITDTSTSTLFPTKRTPMSVSALYVDGTMVDTSNISSFNSSGISLSNSYLSTLSMGDHKIAISYYSGNRIVTETYYQNIYYGTAKSAQTVSTTYGSNDLFQLPGSYTNLYRITCNDKELPFERDDGDSTTYRVPHASLIELLPTVGGNKSSGSVTLFVFTTDGLYRIPITINLSTTAVKNIANFTGEGITSYYYSSTQHDPNINTTYQELRSIDKLNEYYNGNNEILYEQNLHIGASATSLSTQIKYLFDNVAALGKKAIISDDAFTSLARETSTLFGRDVTIGSSTKYFANTTDLDAYVTSRLNLYINEPACYGVNIGDEEVYNSIINGFSDLMHSIHRCLNNLNRNDFYVNTNLQPMSATAEATTGDPNYGGTPESRYSVYLNAYINASQNDYISYDYYPLLNGNAFDGQRLGPYTIRNLVAVAEAAKANNLKVHVITQTFSPSHSSNTYILNHEDEAYLNNMLMAFGVKQICYFTFYHRGSGTGGESWLEHGCVMDADGTRNTLYYYMQGQRAQINALGPILSGFKYDWFYVQRASSTTSRLINPTAYSYYYGNNPYSLPYHDLQSCSTNRGWLLLTGLYNSSANQYMYCVENIYRNTSTQQNRTETATLNFANSVKYFAIYENGSVRIVNATTSGSYSQLVLQLSSGHTAFIVPYQ